MACAAPAQRATAEELADNICAQSGVRGGVVVHTGGGGELTTALCRGTAFTVEYLSPDARAVEAARELVVAQRHGGTATARYWTHDFLPYADHLVNLFIAEEPLPFSMSEVIRVLAPRGVALVKKGNTWNKTVKPWPTEIDEWTHWLHGADGNPVARDDRVGPPRALQWVASPRWSKSHDAHPSMVALVSAGGRVFYIADTGPWESGIPRGGWRCGTCARAMHSTESCCGRSG